MGYFVEHDFSAEIGEFILRFATLESQLEEFIWQSATYLGKDRAIAKEHPDGFKGKLTATFEIISSVLLMEPIYALTAFSSSNDLKSFIDDAQDVRNAICHGQLMEVDARSLTTERVVWESARRKDRIYEMRSSEINRSKLAELIAGMDDAQILVELLIQCLNLQVDGWSEMESGRRLNVYMRSENQLHDLKMKNAGHWRVASGNYEYIGQDAVRERL